MVCELRGSSGSANLHELLAMFTVDIQRADVPEQ